MFPADFIAEGIDQTRGWWVLCIFFFVLYLSHLNSDDIVIEVNIFFKVLHVASDIDGAFQQTAVQKFDR